jgi:hypothetical protein
MKLRIVIAIVISTALAVPLCAYVTWRRLSNTSAIVQQKWVPGAFPLRWQMNPTVGANVTGTASQEDTLKASFATWQALTTANISFSEGPLTATNVKPGYDKINLVTSNLTPAEYGSSALALTFDYSFDQGGVTDQFDRPVDFAGQILEADIMFNPATQFSTSAATAADKIDLQAVATHEVGHFLGLDHTSMLSATMFPYLILGTSSARVLSNDDIAGASLLYPSAAFSSKGTLSGTVRTTANVAVFGAIVTAVNATGQPVASTVTDPTGRYTIFGLDPGAYTLYAEPLDKPITANDLLSYTETKIYGTLSVLTSFTTRFR